MHLKRLLQLRGESRFGYLGETEDCVFMVFHGMFHDPMFHVEHTRDTFHVEHYGIDSE
jgi:hypothetical protein